MTKATVLFIASNMRECVCVAKCMVTGIPGNGQVMENCEAASCIPNACVFNPTTTATAITTERLVTTPFNVTMPELFTTVSTNYTSTITTIIESTTTTTPPAPVVRRMCKSVRVLWIWAMFLCLVTPYAVVFIRSFWRTCFKKTKAPTGKIFIIVSCSFFIIYEYYFRSDTLQSVCVFMYVSV